MGDSVHYQQVGEHEASIRSLHHRLDELKQMLERQHYEHREEVQRIEREVESRVRPLERFKAGVLAISSFVVAIAGVLATWLKAKGIL